jgi:superfamily II DNA or RNA helicase
MFDLEGLRDWQKDALQVFRDTPNKAPLFNVCPGGGKTRFASRLMRGLKESSRGKSFFIVVVPTRHLKSQWKKSLIDSDNLSVRTNIGKGSSGRPDSADGLTTTYAGLQPLLKNIEIWKSQGWKIFGVFDEIHHASEESGRWGSAVAGLGEMSERCILLSGTPFRSDGDKIPMVEYDADGISVGFTYSYRQAVADKVCRPVEFVPFEADISSETIMPGGESFEQKFRWHSDWELDNEGKAIRLGLHTGHETLRNMLEKSLEVLSELKISDPGAAAILHCLGGPGDFGSQADTLDDRFLVRVHDLANKIGFRSRMVSCHDDDSSVHIRKFSTEKRFDCLSSVKQVSEGVDIRRARLNVFLTNITTELYFRQVVGRVARWNPDLSSSQYGVMVFPGTPILTRMARSIEEDARVGLAKREEIEARESGGSGQDTERPRTIVHSSIGQADGVIRRGSVFSKDDEHLATAAQIQPKFSDLSTGHIAEILKAAGTQYWKPKPEAQKVVDEEDQMESLCKKGGKIWKLITRIMNRWPGVYAERSHVISELNKRQGVPLSAKNKQEWVKNKLGLKGLLQRVNILEEMLKGQREEA